MVGRTFVHGLGQERTARPAAAAPAFARAFVVAIAAALLFEAGYVAPVLATAPASRERAADVHPASAGGATPTLDPADEHPGKRTATTRTYDLGGGRYAVEAFADPIFYQPEGSAEWQPIDLAFSATNDGARASVTKSPVAVTVGNQADGLVSLEHRGMRIALRPINAAPGSGDGNKLEGQVPPGSAPGLEGKPQPVELFDDAVTGGLEAPAAAGDASPSKQRADLPDVLPGVGMRVFAHPYGTSNFLVLARRPAESAWTFAVKAKDLTLVPGKDGALDFVDATGKAVARMPAPYAVDSTPDEFTGSGRITTAAWYTLSALGSQQLVTVSVDPAWLASAVYPVYVDPSVTVYNEGTDANGDVHVNRGNPTFRYGNYQRPDSPGYYEMWLGESPSDSTYFNMAFIQFALSAYNGTVVDSATLEVRPYHQYYDAPTSTRTWLRRVTSSWTEDINWNERPGKTDTGMTSAACVEGEQCAFDVTAFVRDWRDGDQPDYGVRLDEIDSNGVEKGPTYWKRLIAAEQGSSTRPRLILTYHNPVAVVSPDGGATAKTSSRTLSWATEQAWGQDMYRVDVSAQQDFSSILATSGDVAGTASAWAIPSSTPLTAGTPYYWRVKARRTTTRATTMWSQYAEGSFTWDPGANLGAQSQHTFESFDLGAGDTAGVNVATGNLMLTHPIVDLPIRGGSLPISLVYNSHDTAPSVGLGAGWRLNLQRRLEISGSNATFIGADGARHVFTLSSGVYSAPKTIYATLTKTAGTPNVYTLTYRDRSVDVFHELSTNTAFLKQSKDRFGNTVTFGYTGTTLTSASDPAGRQVSFSWTSSQLTITDWASVSGGVVQTSGTGNRTHRVLLSGASVSGWADALNTAGSCPTGGSHLTCLTLTNGLVTRISKTQTHETLTGGVLGTATRLIHTEIAYSGTEVASVKDAEQVATAGSGVTFARPSPGLVAVIRPGTPASTTHYVLSATTDLYARVTGVKRAIDGAWIEQRTTYHATYPIEPASVTENYVDGTPSDAAPDEDRTTSYTYVAGSMGLVSRLTEPLTASTHRTTDYTYNANNDVTQTITALDGSGTQRTISRSCYDATCALTGSGLALLKTIENYVDGVPGNGAANVEDVTTTYEYDTACPNGTTCGQRTREIRANYTGAGVLLDQAATGWTYDTAGNQTAEIRNYADGAVTSPGDDITPNATTGARTDLTTAFGYDSAGNRVSTADPRRAVEAAKGTSLGADDFVSRATFDPLGNQLTEKTPTTPGVTITQKTATTAYDELGGLREAVDFGGVVAATESDRAGRATRTFEDTDGAGAAVAAITSISTYDAAGRVLTTKDRRQVADSSLGATISTYDELGQTLTVTEASESSPDIASITATSYDDLGRTSAETVGGLQTTTYAYDLGGRTLRTDDEFACTTRTYDWLDRETGVTEGLSTGTCTGIGTVTTTITLDLFGRPTGRSMSITGGTSETQTATYTSSGPTGATSTIGSATVASTYTVNPLDEVVAEGRSDGSTTKTTYDPAGNATDVCYWKPGVTVGACLPADTAAGSWPNPPTRAHTAAYDARNGRITLITKLGTSSMVSTTTYDPDHAYQVSAVYLPTAGDREVQDLYAYDAQHRVTSITHQLCVLSSGHACSSTTPMGSSAYAYDASSNRTSVTESSTGGTPSTRTYCYDALDRLTASRATSSCATSPDETYSYDDAGNRLTAMTGGSTRSFFHDGDTGQLETCTVPSCSVSYDGAGRTSTLTDNGTSWTFAYDGDGRVASACAGTTCTGSGFNRIDYRYDATGRRVAITTTTAGGTVTTTDLRYAGLAIAQESVAGSVTRTYATDDAGRITLVCDPDCDTGTRYLVTWNGHGDATGLWRRNADGTLTLANSYTYSTWGAPTTTTHNGIADLGFRFLYVGSGDVQWDNAFGLGLYYMHARHYSPMLGRFLQPDPSAAETNLYGYAQNGPVTKADPSGLDTQWFWCIRHPGACAYASQLRGPLIRQAVALFGRASAHNGRGDAWRHCALIGCVAGFVGRGTAIELGKAHESDEPNDARETKMDLHNNRVGARIGNWYHKNVRDVYNFGRIERFVKFWCLVAVLTGELDWIHD